MSGISRSSHPELDWDSTDEYKIAGIMYTAAITRIIELEQRTAKLVAALKEARKYMEGYNDDHYRTVLEQIEEALNPTPR